MEMVDPNLYLISFMDSNMDWKSPRYFSLWWELTSKLPSAIFAKISLSSGRGFAVVAGEIGKLAGQSAEAATNTRELIQKSMSEVESGNGIAKETAEAFYAVNEGIKKVVELNGIVKEDCENQAQGVNEINAVLLIFCSCPLYQLSGLHSGKVAYACKTVLLRINAMCCSSFAFSRTRHRGLMKLMKESK